MCVLRDGVDHALRGHDITTTHDRRNKPHAQLTQTVAQLMTKKQDD